MHKPPLLQADDFIAAGALLGYSVVCDNCGGSGFLAFMEACPKCAAGGRIFIPEEASLTHSQKSAKHGLVILLLVITAAAALGGLAAWYR